MDRKDYEKLREKIEEECFAAAFGASIGEALMDALDAENATPEELEEIAERLGIDI